MSSRKMMLIVLSVMLVAGLAIVSSALAQDVTVRFSTFDTGEGLERNQGVIDEFTADTGIAVEIELADGAGDPQILVQMAAGTAPDVIQSGELSLRRRALGSEGGFLDLTPYIDADPNFSADMFFPTVFDVGVLDGDVYAITKDFATTAFYVNTGMFDEAGIPIPEEGWTYDDLLEIGQELTLDANGNNALSPDFDPENIVQYGWWINTDWVRGWQPLAYSFGGQILSDDGLTATGYLNSAEVVAAMQFYKDAIHEYHIAPGAATLEAQPGVDLFNSSQVAIRGPRGPWHITGYSENPDIDMVTVPMPAGPEGRYSVICWSGFSVNKNTEYPQESYELVKYLGTVGQNTFVNHAMSANIEASNGSGRDQDPLWSVFLNEIPNLHPLDDLNTAYWVECIDTPVKNLMQAIAAPEGGDTDVQAELDSIAEAADECLAQES
jgi:multiple sugar transport system substrate-binding protein